MEQYRVTAPIEIEHAELIWRNFSGKANKFNAEGQRNFNVIIDPDMYAILKTDGWNARMHQPREDQDPDTPPLCTLQVKVSFGRRPPKIVLISGGKQTMLDESTVDMLDFIEIARNEKGESLCDLVINPYNYDVGGRQGVSGYLKAIYVTIAEDRFAAKYADAPMSALDSIVGE